VKVALFKVPPTYSTWHHRPVLGLSYLAAVLQEKGVDVRIFDAHFHQLSSEKLASLLIEFRPDIVGATAMTHEIKPAADIVRKVKEKMDCTAVVGGPHVTALPERTLKEFPVFDCGVCGEGEKAILALVERIERDGELSDIEGLVFHDKDGEVRFNSPAPLLTSEELDDLPFPAFGQYYGDNPDALRAKKEEYPIITSRGCPYNCAFCMRVLGKKIRRRSPENIVGEIEFAVSTYGAHTINFQDEIFLSDTAHTRKVLQMIIDKGLNKRIRWVGLTRANLVNEDIIALAKESGCFHIEMGVESGSEEILRNIKKGISIEQIRKAVKIIKGHGLYLVTYYILGHPGETRQTVEDTIRLAAELNTDHIAVGLMVPYPGTQIYDYALKGEEGYKLLTEDWSRYDKYGARSLELESLTYDELSRLQKKMYLNLYIRNLRVLDLIRFVWERRSAVMYFLKRRILGK
jgi:radical SAM superfamily enzyme YgiQ (UPF0313 family)